MSANPKRPRAAEMTPGLDVPDVLAAHWLAEVNLRLRREVCWCWHQRHGCSEPSDGRLPALADPADDSLQQIRYRDAKASFFANDTAAAHLSELLGAMRRPAIEDVPTMGFSRVVRELDLSEAHQFVLGLALAHRVDASLGPVFATIMNDLSRPFPSMALAQRVWDEPTALFARVAADERLHNFGILRRTTSASDWQAPLDVPAAVAEVLTGFGARDSADLREAPASSRPLDAVGAEVAHRLERARPRSMEIIALVGERGSAFEAWAQSATRASGRALLVASARVLLDPSLLLPLATTAWLMDADLLLPEGVVDGGRPLEQWLSQTATLPVRWFLPTTAERSLASIPRHLLFATWSVPGLEYGQRLELLTRELGDRARGREETLEDCARRFRFPELELAQIVESLKHRDRLDADTIIETFRASVRADLGQLAAQVKTRFGLAELVLPPEKSRQVEEILGAMRALTRVHYRWGTARAWNEGGLAVLFSGPPGTGKTMAAEAIAHELGQDLFRVDLSQVVNKYIGETEKNLKRIFDAADRSDCILFFDEADALFGRRTEVKSAHDRFANIEVSYLLERMERFKGLAILATNRRKDLDEAFLRRLRYVVEFEVPGVSERRRIWELGFPEPVDTSELDFAYLAKNFVLSGGHVRSVIFNACLQAAARNETGVASNGKVGKVTMRDVIVQLKRELTKMDRAVGDEQFGKYAGVLEERVV